MKNKIFFPPIFGPLPKEKGFLPRKQHLCLFIKHLAHVTFGGTQVCTFFCWKNLGELSTLVKMKPVPAPRGTHAPAAWMRSDSGLHSLPWAMLTGQRDLPGDTGWDGPVVMRPGSLRREGRRSCCGCTHSSALLQAAHCEDRGAQARPRDEVACTPTMFTGFSPGNRELCSWWGRLLIAC